MKRWQLLLVLPWLPLPGPALGQGLYRPTPSPVIYEATNEYFLFFVHGADTLGQPVTTRTRERHVTSPMPDGLKLVVDLEGLDAPFRTTDTFDIAPNGRVRLIGGQRPAERPVARVDLLPRFPPDSPALSVGLEWTDTVSIAQARSYGSTYYRVRRQYRVERLVDSLSTTVALIRAIGQMALRQGGWQDSVAGVAWWQEVTGPIIDSVWFDVTHGFLLGDVSRMNLAGTGAVGGAVMPTSLRSLVRRTHR